MKMPSSCLRSLSRSFAAMALAGSLVSSFSAKAADDPWKPWIEADFPFFSSALDLRPQEPKDAKEWNITPRGIVLNLGHDCWACFDTDLLRVSAVWTGKGVTADSLAPLSYQNKPLKTVGGQSKLPKPDGTVWLINGVYPGWQLGDKVSFEDKREPQPSPEEPGRGPIPPEVGQFKSVSLFGSSAILNYTVASSTILESVTAGEKNGKPVVQRHLYISPCKQALTLVVGRMAKGEIPDAKKLVFPDGAKESVVPNIVDGTIVLHVPAGLETVFACTITIDADGVSFSGDIKDMPVFKDGGFSANRWPQEVVTKAVLSTSKDAYVEDEIPLPLENPWKRNVRLADVAFFKDGTAAGVTVDGDVWMIRGLKSDLGDVHWKRFTTGLHEPMSIVVRDEQLYVFDRNGIWHLRDTNGDGVADVHELVCNLFPQSAESREFPNSMKLAPDGSFVISKGGQQASTNSKLNGSVLRIAPDGKSWQILGVGFRQPFVGVNPRTGLITASDQEGNYVPTTPLYIVKNGEYHGFLSELLPKEQYPAPIADPLTWIPHPVNPSAATQVWLFNAKMGPLNDSLVHVAFNRPELFSVLLNERTQKPQAAVVSIIHDFDIPVLNAEVNPADGDVYLAGFQVIGWGTTATRVSGFGRVRYTGATCPVPREVVPMDKGVLLRFDAALDPQKATDPSSYSLESWHYKRTYKYGSPHLKADETPGQDWLTPSSAYLSKDGKSVFVGVPGMKPVQQMRIGWGIAATDGTRLENNAFFTPYELVKFNPTSEGFGDITVDLTPKAAVAQTAVAPTVEEGKRLYQLMGCMACHAVDDTVQPKIGPPWKGLYGKTVQISKGPDVVADDAYIKESILIPSAKVVKGYEKVEAGMPVYQGVLSDSQIQSIILFIKSLK